MSHLRFVSPVRRADASRLTVGRRGRGGAALLAAATLVLAGCSGTPDATSTDAAAGEITVFAASSLTDAFTEIGRLYEKAHPGAAVTFNFGASSTLATQITQGAPADVFASASTRTMDTVVSAGRGADVHTFAVNTMEIATPPAPRVTVTSLADLAKPGAKVAVCQKAVPCGAAAVALFEKNGVSVTPVSEEADVRAVMAKVVLGEVDAGIVYVTDVKAAGDAVGGVTIPAADNVTTDYPISEIKDSANASTAQAFVDFVISSPEARKVLTDAGFAAP